MKARADRPKGAFVALGRLGPGLIDISKEVFLRGAALETASQQFPGGVGAVSRGADKSVLDCDDENIIRTLGLFVKRVLMVLARACHARLDLRAREALSVRGFRE